MQFQMSYHVSKKYSSIYEAFFKHFQMSYHVSKKYSSIYEAFFKHFQSISKELMKHLKKTI
jgi:hypothetical protein